jgi:hypothetical protein
MTAYLKDITLSGTSDGLTLIKPQDPMTPSGCEEEVDYSSIKSFDGFLRTQIGRYMKVQQYVGASVIEDRYGFLVGVGGNFIILQEINSGNILVLDIYSVRTTYVYYAPPVVPQG